MPIPIEPLDACILNNPSSALTSFNTIERDSSTPYTSPTVFVSTPNDRHTESSVNCTIWKGPQRWDLLQELSMYSFIDECKLTADTAIERFNVVKDDAGEHDSKGLLDYVQNKLNRMQPNSLAMEGGFRAIAVDEKSFTSNWSKLEKASKTSSGFLVLSVKENSDNTNLNSIFSFIGGKSKLKSEITGFKVYITLTSDKQREDLSKLYDHLGSRVLDNCKGNSAPSRETIDRLLKSHPGCTTIELPEKFTELPIFDDIRYIKTLDDWPPTRGDSTQTM